MIGKFVEGLKENRSPKMKINILDKDLKSKSNANDINNQETYISSDYDIIYNPEIWKPDQDYDDEEFFNKKYNDLVNNNKLKKQRIKMVSNNSSNKILKYPNNTISNKCYDPQHFHNKLKSDTNIINKNLNYKNVHNLKYKQHDNILFSPQMDVIRNILLNTVLYQNHSINVDTSRNNYSLTNSPIKSYVDPLYRINLERIFKGKDKRVTIMIRNIPNKYSLMNLNDEIKKVFKGKYNMLYLPLDYNNNSNLGFAFLNFIDPFHIIYFYDEFIGRKWNKFNSEKICDLAYSKIQGEADLYLHYEKASMSKTKDEEKNSIFKFQTIKNCLEIPLKYLDLFISIYPYSEYTIRDKVFIIKSLYNF